MNNYFKNPVIQSLMVVLSWLYGLIIQLKRSLYASGIFESHKLPVKTICVGNITVGGSGKTTTVLFLAKYFQSKNKKVSVISRGYKRIKNKLVLIVSDENNILSLPEESGDEPYLMAKKLDNIPILVGSSRYLTGLETIKRFSPEMILFDDGFQHWQLNRDLDIVCVDATIPLETENLFPAGILREPVSALNRAGIIVLTHTDLITDGQRIQWQQFLHKTCPTVAVVETYHKVNHLKHMLSESILSLNNLAGKPVILLSSLGNNTSFVQTITRNLTLEIEHHYCFPDHHCYTINDLLPIGDRATKNNLKIITTEKDAIRLLPLVDKHKFPWFDNFYVLEIELAIVAGEEKWAEKLNCF